MSAPPALVPVGFADLAGWHDDDHRAALQTFRISAAAIAAAPPSTRALGISGAALAGAARAATLLPDEPNGRVARDFFETWFVPCELNPMAEARAFFTGYYEPEVAGSRTPDPAFQTSLYGRPDDLVDIDDGNRPAGLDPSFRFARQESDRLTEYPDRAAIMAGALAGRGLEIAWLADPAEAFFVHIQGSARLRLPNGEILRVAYAAKSGHPYTPIGRVLVERGALRREEVSMAAIRAWLAENRAAAPEVMAANRSFIFFRETAGLEPGLGPVGAAGVQLTPGRSLAVDRTLHTFHTPVWVETAVPVATGSPEIFRRLLVAQDTGSAIVGPSRGDIFFGSGDAAGAVAGAMQSGGRFVVLKPREAAP